MYISDIFGYSFGSRFGSGWIPVLWIHQFKTHSVIYPGSDLVRDPDFRRFRVGSSIPNILFSPRCHTTFNKAMNSKNQGGPHKKLRYHDKKKSHSVFVFFLVKENLSLLMIFWKVCFTVSHTEFFLLIALQFWIYRVSK